jgi:hypothetical protein
VCGGCGGGGGGGDGLISVGYASDKLVLAMHCLFAYDMATARRKLWG